MTSSPAPDRRRVAALSLAALGVVYGDIGTSPLYALRECFHGSHGMAPSYDNVLGVLSLILWALLLLISLKYLVFVLKVDNRGEGGILALASRVTPMQPRSGGRKKLLIFLALFGAALLYGDGMITPAISVLSAVEGLRVATPFFSPYVIPITVVILIALFSFQKHGTGHVGAVFGPVILAWFGVLAILGIAQIAREPSVLLAIDPRHAAEFLARNEWQGFLVLGSVFLVVTGGEALYADMGHFGAKPIRLAWFVLVLPSLVLNYLGQGALLVHSPQAAENPFYLMAPEWALYPLVVLGTAATVIASQAVISGAFSLTLQALQLGFCPRVDVAHTSTTEIGQVYVPFVNWVLMLACIGLVLGFESSSALAAAYGVAVTATMVITTILLFVFLRWQEKWRLLVAGLLTGAFLVVDLSFFAANATKIAHGGWFPLLVAAVVFTLMVTWKRGRELVSERIRPQAISLRAFLPTLIEHPPTRVQGTAVFMYGNRQGTPPALLHNLKHNRVLHERVVVVVVETDERAAVPDRERVEIEDLAASFHRVMIRFGYSEDPDVPAVLWRLTLGGSGFEPMNTSFFLGRENLIASQMKGMALWRERLFSWMSRNAQGATFFFHLPPNRVVELGAQIEL